MRASRNSFAPSRLSSIQRKDFKGSSKPKFLLVGTHADKHWSLFHQSLSGKNRWLKKSLGELKSMCIEVSPDGDILLPINTLVTKGRNEVAPSIRQKIMDACSDALRARISDLLDGMYLNWR